MTSMIDSVTTERDDPPVIPEEIWDAAPWLRYVHDLARARLLAPPALLGAVLARVCAVSDYKIVTPPDIVGTYGSPNLIAILVGKPGAGKGNALRVAQDVLNALGIQPDWEVKIVPYGTGEGLFHAFCEHRLVIPDSEEEEIQEEDEEKPEMKLVQVRHNVLVQVDEGMLIEKTSQRAGQTLVPVLQCAWSGEDLGRQLADPLRSLKIPWLNYRLAVLLAMQPKVCQFIFDAEGTGLPQRLLWFAAYDLEVPDEDTPEPAPPDELRPEDDAVPPGDVIMWQPTYSPATKRIRMVPVHYAVIGVDPDVREAIRRVQRMNLRGETPTMDTHRGFTMLKLACAIAFLGRSLSVTWNDWEIALAIGDYSKKAAEWTRRQAGAAEETKAIHAARKAGVRQVETEETAANARLEKVEHYAAVARDILARSDGPMTGSQIISKVWVGNRGFMPDALAYAVEARMLTKRTDGRFELAG